MSKLSSLRETGLTEKGWAFLFLCFNGAFWAFLLLRPVGHAQLVAIDDILQCIGPLLAASLCLLHLRRRWLGASLFLGLGILAYVLGQGIWSFNKLIVKWSYLLHAAILVWQSSRLWYERFVALL